MSFWGVLALVFYLILVHFPSKFEVKTPPKRRNLKSRNLIGNRFFGGPSKRKFFFLSCATGTGDCLLPDFQARRSRAPTLRPAVQLRGSSMQGACIGGRVEVFKALCWACQLPKRNIFQARHWVPKKGMKGFKRVFYEFTVFTFFDRFGL